MAKLNNLFLIFILSNNNLLYGEMENPIDENNNIKNEKCLSEFIDEIEKNIPENSSSFEIKAEFFLKLLRLLESWPFMDFINEFIKRPSISKKIIEHLVLPIISTTSDLIEKIEDAEFVNENKDADPKKIKNKNKCGLRIVYRNLENKLIMQSVFVDNVYNILKIQLFFQILALRESSLGDTNSEFIHNINNFKKRMKDLFSSETHVFNSKESAIEFFNSIINITKNAGIGYLYEVLRTANLIEDINKLMIQIISCSNSHTGEMEIIIFFKYYENNREMEGFIKYNTTDNITHNFYRKHNNYYVNYAYGSYSKKIPIYPIKNTIIFEKELFAFLELINYSKDKILLD
jgi:hypothetical protein